MKPKQDGFKGRVVKIDPVHPDSDPSLDAVGQAVHWIRSGGMIAFPTETYYGLGVDPFNSAAVERLFVVKGREAGKPILIVVDDIKKAEGIIVAVSPEAWNLIRKFWPGPLTLLLAASPRLPSALTGGTGKIGIRIPSHPVALQLLRAAAQPITATSANPSGHPEATTASKVHETLGTHLDLIVDGGETSGGNSSTIVDATFHPPRLIREGRIPFREVLGCLGLSLTEDHEW
ncbi:MAG TPA: L-threonylcarbamoyladenylate synthase [Nitrospiria bacterium]|nr:L-threonylcarbamoyladenylate synthase [Nitrospiria bacterium]